MLGFMPLLGIVKLSKKGVSLNWFKPAAPPPPAF